MTTYKKESGKTKAEAAVPAQFEDEAFLRPEIRNILEKNAANLENISVKFIYESLAHKFSVPAEIFRDRPALKALIKHTSIQLIEELQQAGNGEITAENHASPVTTQQTVALQERIEEPTAVKGTTKHGKRNSVEKEGGRSDDDVTAAPAKRRKVTPRKSKGNGKTSSKTGERVETKKAAKNFDNSRTGQLRKLVTDLSFGPTVYRGLTGDENEYYKSLKERIISKCRSLNITSGNSLPTASEVAAYQKKRLREKDLEGVDVSNIIEGVRRTRKSPLAPSSDADEIVSNRSVEDQNSDKTKSGSELDDEFEASDANSSPEDEEFDEYADSGAE